MENRYRMMLSVLTLSVPFVIQAKDMTRSDATIAVTASSKQSSYAASSRNVSSVRVDNYRLEEANVTNTQTLNKVLPGFNFASSDSSLNPLTSIRGFTSVGNWYNSSVTLYVDGVPQPPVGFSQPLDNIASVEVLKGSQATLYGAAAEGGIINIITAQPGNDYRGYLQGGYASRDGYRGKFNVSGPLAEGILYGSISGMRDVQHGRMFNPGTGHKNLGGEANNIGSVKLRLAPDNQPWQLGVSYNGQCMDSSAGLMIDPADPNSTTGVVSLADAQDPAIHRCMLSQSVNGQYTTEHLLFTLISSWQQTRADKTIAGNLRVPVFSFPERWLGDVQELRVSTTGKNNLIDGVLGLYRQNTRAWIGHYTLDNQGRALSGSYQSFTSRQSVAAYGDITWHVNDKLDFAAGLRFSRDSGKTQYPGASGDKIFNGDIQDNHLSGQVSAGYQLTQADRVYTRIAQGYKPIGYDYRIGGRPEVRMLEPRAIRPETSITWEIGNKYHTDTLNLQGAIFYNRITDTQMYRYDGVNALGLNTRRLANAGDSRAIGFELNGDYTFIPGWRAGSNVNLINSKFTGDSKNNNKEGMYANKNVPFVPEFSAGIYISGTVNTAIGVFSPYIGLNYTGSYSFDDKDFRQSAYSIADASLSWQATDRITLSAWIDNLFDKRYLTYAQYPQYGYVNFGRTAGIDMKIDLF